MSNLPLVQLLVNFTDESAPPLLSMASATDLSFGDGRGVNSIQTARGRSTELGAVQTGTMSADVVDPQETLNPSNPSTPFNIAPYRLLPYRGTAVRAWWPHTGNMINTGTYGNNIVTAGADEDIATNLWAVTPTSAGVVDLYDTAPPGSEDAGYGEAGYGEGSYGGDVTAAVIRILADGPTAEASPMTSGQDALSSHYWTLPGQVHTYSVWIKVAAASTGTTAWLEIDDLTSAVVAIADGWTRVSITWTPTLNRTPIVLHVEGGPAGTLTQTVYLYREQLELGAAPTAWTDEGPVRYRLWTGYIERWPLSWEDRGYTGIRPLEAVDGLAVAARTQIRDDYDEMVKAHGYAAYFPLTESGAPAHGQGVSGSRVLLRERPAVGVGGAARGSSFAWGGATLPDGTKCLQISQQIQNPADVPWADQVARVDNRIGLADPAPLFSLDTRGGTLEGWVRVFAGACAMTVNDLVNGENRLYFGFNNVRISEHAALYWDNTETPTVFKGFPPVRSALVTNPSLGSLDDVKTFLDDDWHYWAVTFEPHPTDATKHRTRWRFDADTFPGSINGAHKLLRINYIHLSAQSVFGDPESRAAFARLAFYPRALTDAETLEHYQRGLGHDGETAQARATRLLTRYWGGPAVVNSGAGRPMGPDHTYGAGTLLNALEDIALADDAMAIARADGTIVMQSSLTRARNTDVGPSAVFGEDTEAGELPYQGVEYDYDPTDLYSRVSVSRPGRSGPIVLVDETIEALIGPRTLSRSVNVQDDYELEEIARTYQRRYGQARLRVKAVKFQPHANPSLWQTLLLLDVSERVTLRRRTSAGFVMEGDFYIESVKHDIDKEASTWTVSFELSPAAVGRPWVLGDPDRGVLGSTTAPAH